MAFLYIRKKECIEQIEVVEIDKPNQKDRKLLHHETQQLRRVTDMAYTASVVSCSIKDATVKDLVLANKFIKLLKCNAFIFSFPQINDLQNESLVCFSNASFANLKCGGSKGGLLSVSTRKKWEIYVISLTIKKAKESSQKYLNCRNISVAGSNRSSYNDQSYVP